MWLVLADTGDDAAMWAAEGLQQRGVRPVRVVSAQELAHQTVWEHRLMGGGVRTRLRFQDGAEVGDAQLRGVVNRLSGFAVPPAEVLSGDREYAACEHNALLLSWLASLRCPVVNRPSPAGCPGGYRSVGEWRGLAHRAGLRIVPLVQPEPSGSVENNCGNDAGGWRMVFVVAGHVVAGCGGGWDAATVQGCVRLSGLAGHAVLAVQFVCFPGRVPLFYSATPQGDLRLGGSRLLDLLVGELT